jgi:hypothetical protein
VRVDEAGRNDEPIGVDGASAIVVDGTDRADLDDPTALEPDVAAVRRRAGAVDDRAALDHTVDHRVTSVSWP